MAAWPFKEACDISPGGAVLWEPPMVAAMAEFDIDTMDRKAMFLAEVCHECFGFSRLSENLNYSANGLADTWPNRFRGDDGKPNELALKLARIPEAIANMVYANRLGNGDYASGDGWRYRGRGCIQLTGKANYSKAADALNAPELVTNPSVVATPFWAARTAAWFWKANDLNRFADSGDIEGCTRAINGGLNGLEDRKRRWGVAKAALGVKSAA